MGLLRREWGFLIASLAVSEETGQQMSSVSRPAVRLLRLKSEDNGDNEEDRESASSKGESEEDESDVRSVRNFES